MQCCARGRVWLDETFLRQLVRLPRRDHRFRELRPNVQSQCDELLLRGDELSLWSQTSAKQGCRSRVRLLHVQQW